MEKLKYQALFRLRGKDYTLKRGDVERQMSGVEPKSIDKHFVLIGGRPYPPKQVFAEALRLPLLSFTTMDATRILMKLGFEAGTADEAGVVGQSKTESELLFEEYLGLSGLTQFQYEPELPKTTMRPDYSLALGTDEILFEVKEFRATKKDFAPGADTYDSYRPIREKINAARKQFKDLENHCCCLVLFNRDKPLVRLEWRFIYGAMLGNLGILVPVDYDAGIISGEIRQVFTTGGKMLKYQGDRPVGVQNTTLSAVIVLELLDIGQRRFTADLRRRERELGGKLGVEAFWHLIERARGTERDVSLRQARVVVHENPYARIHLPKNIFRGPYDERYGVGSEGETTRLFAGEQIQNLETLQEKAQSYGPSPSSLVIKENKRKGK